MAILTNNYQYLGRSEVMKSQSGKLSYYLLLYGKTSANQSTGIHSVKIKSVLASINTNATYYLYTQAHNGKINDYLVFSGTNKPSSAWELSSFTEGGVTYKTGTVLGEGELPVDCTNGLDKDITLSCYYAFKDSGAEYTPLKATARTVSVTATLSAIPRGATLLTAPNFSDEDNPTIAYSNPSGNNVTSLEAAIYNSSGTQSYIPYKSIEKTKTSYKFELTDAERSNLYRAAQSNTLPIRFYIRTTIGDNTYLSYLDRTFSINDADPIITANVTDVNSVTIALTGDNNKLIRYYSDAHAVMSIEPQKGATIDESLCIIRNGNTTEYTTERYIERVEDNEFTFIAEDNRGNIGAAYVTPEMIPYIKLTCNVANNRPDVLGNMTVACSGNYFNGSFGAVANTLTVQYRYCVSGSASYSAWSDMTVTKNGNSYYASKDFVIPNFDQQLYYTFEIKAADKLATIQKTGGSVKSTPMFHWGENDFVFEVPVTFNAGVGGVDGIWTPSLSSSAVSSYTTQYGWYSKMGQSVTVGFFVKATCKSGYNSTAISISGLPFTPLYSAAGGGMCSGAYVSGGFNFQCFVADTSKSITTRVQSCNHTSQTNLSTSASGCWYPSGGGEVTLSGTISFIANS